MRAIQVEGDVTLRQRYQALLRSDWEVSDAASCCALLESLLESGGARVSFRDVSPEPTSNGNIDVFRVPPHLSEHLQDFLERANAQAIESDEQHEGLPKRRAKGKRELAELANRVSFFLVFPDLVPEMEGRRARIAGDSGLYRDTQSLLFNIAAIELLPALRASRMGEEEDWLVRVMLAHALIVWQSNPSHQQSLRALVYEHLGDVERSEQALRLALALTPPTEPARVSKVHALWAFLSSEKRWEEATELLLTEYRSVPESSLADIRDLLDLTYEGRGLLQAG